MGIETQRPTIAEIDLGALRANFHALRAVTSHRELMVVVKADAYGHGAVTVAKCLGEEGCRHFGVATLYRLGRNRRVRMGVCLGITALCMGFLIPELTNYWWWVYPLGYGVFSVNHWLTEIGLCGLASQRSVWLIACILLLGCVGFLWWVPTPTGDQVRPPTWLIPAVFAPLFGLGIVHFLYSRWVWRLGDPEVRATIGKGFGDRL